MTPGHFGLASGDVIWSYTTPASPPAVGGGILSCIRVVPAGDTVATIGLLVERDVGDGDTLELLEPLLDFSRVGGVHGCPAASRPGALANRMTWLAYQRIF